MARQRLSMIPEPHIDDAEIPPVPLLHDFYYEIVDGAPVLSPRRPDEQIR